MGQRLSCRETHEHGFFTAVQNGELETVEAMVDEDPSVLRFTAVHGKLSALHVAAANGQIEILCMLLDKGLNPDILNRHKQTPLMLAAIHGKLSCVERLLQAGANILMFDSLHGRTCLHYAGYYGHSDCLQSILSAAHSAHVAQSWGFARYVNTRDGSGATSLHLAARHRRAECVRLLLSNEALVCASTGGYGFCSYPGCTPLHLAARAGSLDCVRELLAWGADRLQRDASGRLPYMIALKHKHEVCAALLNPSSPEPLTWPSPLKLITELDAEAKGLLENALIDANKERERKILKETGYTSPLHCDSDNEDFEVSDLDLCCICFEQACTIEIQKCGHQMCAHCTLALCCHNKPNPTKKCDKVPTCPFCRSSITQLVIAKNKTENKLEELSPSRSRMSRTSFNLAEDGCGGSESCGGSSSSSNNTFKVLSPLASFAKLGGRSSGKVTIDCIEGFNKP
nr:putative E3 ubiquitin-protein ligase XBAT31 [Ipomoea batatas]